VDQSSVDSLDHTVVSAQVACRNGVKEKGHFLSEVAVDDGPQTARGNDMLPASTRTVPEAFAGALSGSTT